MDDEVSSPSSVAVVEFQGLFSYGLCRMVLRIEYFNFEESSLSLHSRQSYLGEDCLNRPFLRCD